MTWLNRLGKWLMVGSVIAGTTASGVGCLTRPVSKQEPTTKVNFSSTVSQQAVDKVDLLLVIDNSGSMGDKQGILAEAVPLLVNGLIRPKCVDKDGKPTGTTADPLKSTDDNYGCGAPGGGVEPEFRPVVDMHIGIIDSSLGSFGGDICPDQGRLNSRAHLLNSGPSGVLPQTEPLDKGKNAGGFLAWYPQNKDNSDKARHPEPVVPGIGAEADFANAFGQLVKGVGETGCGLEAQLESFYRFLIQPDPWAKVTVDQGTLRASLGSETEVDAVLLKQRADFLRPNSLVAIIMLTDEQDSSADPLSVAGQGWAFMASQFPGNQTVFRTDGRTTTAPRGTSVCSKNPGDPGCTSCGFAATCNASDPACAAIKNDPNCANGGYYGPTDDSLNVRFHRMKERYGIDPQYPIKRYVDGLKNLRVPNRKTEHILDKNGVPGLYEGTPACTNPLFAGKLPSEPGDDLCNLPRGTRTPDLVFFAVVGGVPNRLIFDGLESAASDADKIAIVSDPDKRAMNRAKWAKVLGEAPEVFNYSGIDTHMVESVNPRCALDGTCLPPPSQTRGDNGTDPDHGREFDTQKDDLQYACTFEILENGAPKPRNCTTPDCDCPPASKGGDKKNPPLCGPSNDPNVGIQTRAKAYPTTREFMVVRDLGEQGIISSLCPITLKGAKDSPIYGYNPAVQAIIDRLKNALTTQCLPQQLTRDEKNLVPCLVLATLPQGDPATACDQYGLKPPAPEILTKFREQQRAESAGGGPGATDLSKLPVCQVTQKDVPKGATCKDEVGAVWCYVENDGNNAPAGRCPQALIFSNGSSQLAGARYSLQCIQQFGTGVAAGDPAAPANP